MVLYLVFDKFTLNCYSTFSFLVLDLQKDDQEFIRATTDSIRQRWELLYS